MPQPDFTLTFNYQGGIYVQAGEASYKVPASMISGGNEHYKRYLVLRNTSMIVVKFKTCAITSFFDFPQTSSNPSSRFLGYFVDHNELNQLEQNLAEAVNNRERVCFIEQFLCKRLKQTNRDLLVDTAARKIMEAGGNLKIQELCRMLYISESQFEKRFRKAVGVSAKKYASLIRIDKILADNRTDHNLTDKAYEAGYFDQAHFIRDFKARTGYTPLRFFKLKTDAFRTFLPLGIIEPEHRVSA